MTVYIDSLFFTNFFMDSVIIFITAVMRRRQLSASRLFISAAVSALYGTLIFFPSLDFLYSAGLKIIFSTVPVMLAFGKSCGIKDFLISWAVFWFITLACGGAVFVISTMTDFGSVMQTMTSNFIMYVNINPLVLLAGCSLLYILAAVYRRICIKSFTADKLLLELEADYMGEKYSFVGLIDTGCELTEPLSDAPVIVADKRIFRDALVSGAQIKINTAAGDGILDIIFPEKILCANSEAEIVHNTVIALSGSRFSEYGIYNAVINPAAVELCRGDNIKNDRLTRCCK